ncbi:unnamed protein product [Kuraishia capsulata CBS 1993]|uniref:Uncharacterized protein n=1 Tax=Kuraishia capsulata CBS 1993 TaxID=1382522 RepID=W6MPI7_9ASCO|nr:uncharacterized protein KUCA_T00004225001 [Kuraishia capsulata CBS 1993]CDK28243.1 unnamed protein product [Kuraishia capsulata CBS 1993]
MNCFIAQWQRGMSFNARSTYLFLPYRLGRNSISIEDTILDNVSPFGSVNPEGFPRNLNFFIFVCSRSLGGSTPLSARTFLSRFVQALSGSRLNMEKTHYTLKQDAVYSMFFL